MVGALMSALNLKALLFGGGVALFVAGGFVGKYVSKPAAPQPCVVVLPNTPAFTLTEEEKKAKEKFYKDLAAGQQKDRETSKRWIVP